MKSDENKKVLGFSDYLNLVMASILTLLRLATLLFALSALGLAALLGSPIWLIWAVASVGMYVPSSFLMFKLMGNGSVSQGATLSEIGNFPFNE